MLYPELCFGVADRTGRVPSVKRNQKETVPPGGTTTASLSGGRAARALVVVMVAVSRGVHAALMMSLVLVPKSAMDPGRVSTLTAKEEPVVKALGMDQEKEVMLTASELHGGWVRGQSVLRSVQGSARQLPFPCQASIAQRTLQSCAQVSCPPTPR